MMYAYDKEYLYHAQKNFGHMIDFATNTCDIEIDDFFEIFTASDVCKQFENGNPAYIAGKTGCELARMAVWQVKEQELQPEDVMYLDRSPEYWLGWSLAYYLWEKNYKVDYVLNAVSPEEMLGMYDTLHEADVSKFVSHIDERLHLFYDETALTRMRNVCGISQIELSKRSGVNLRVIQS